MSVPSRIARRPITVPSGVTVTINGKDVNVQGPKGKLDLKLIDDITVNQGEEGITVQNLSNARLARAMVATTHRNIMNMIKGVSDGFSKKLIISGVGYRAAMQGQDLALNLGFSHDVKYRPVQGVEIKCESPTVILVSGIDKQAVGQTAAEIRAYRPPEPYKGKGVAVEGEHIVRKEGKKK